MKVVKIYTDGSCSGNPGPGGWAVVVNTEKECKKYSGGDENTTNNRMELYAVIRCFLIVLLMDDGNTRFDVFSDSAYVVNSINKGWLEYWKQNRWRTKSDSLVKNKDLWELASICMDTIKGRNIDIKIEKIKGHSGNTFNDLCDKIAKEATMSIQPRK